MKRSGLGAQLKVYAQRGFEPLVAHTRGRARFRNTVMPWLAHSGFTEKDLGAIYDHLRTLPPIENHVESLPDVPAVTSEHARGG